MNKFPHEAIEKMLPLGIPRLSLSLPAFVKFIGQQMIASAEELEAEKQPVKEEAGQEAEETNNVEEAEAKTESEAEITKDEGHVEAQITEGPAEVDLQSTKE